MSSDPQGLRGLAPFFAAFLALGVGLSFFGPALPTLRDQTGSTIAQIGLVFAAQSVGGLLGSIAAGRLYRRFGGPHLIAVAVFALAAALALTALATELVVVIALGAVLGLGAGTMDVGANTYVPTVVEPAALVSSMNALHLGFAIGAVATPLLIGLSIAVTDGLGLACAVFGGVLALLGVVLWRRDRATAAAHAAAQHEEAGPSPAAWRLALVAMFFLLYVGLEVCFAGWIATYADELGLGAGWPTILTTVFWAGFLVGRLLMVWRGDRFPTGRVLWVSVVTSTMLAVAIAGLGAQAVAVAVACALFGIVIAPQFPTMLAHLHRVVPLTGTVTAWCIAGSAVGGLVLPPLLGALLESVGAAALPWTVAAAAVASGVALALVDRFTLAGPQLRPESASIAGAASP